MYKIKIIISYNKQWHKVNCSILKYIYIEILKKKYFKL